MTGVFYHSVIHYLGFFICFMISILHAQNNKTRFFYVLYSDKTSVFDQSGRAQGPICVINHNKQFHMKVLLNSFHLNGHKLGFHPQTHKLELP